MYKDKTLEAIEAMDAYYEQKYKEDKQKRRQALKERMDNMSQAERLQIKESQSEALAALFETNYFSHCVRDIVLNNIKIMI